jgi:sterol desaturase/sphingolipid hydroxylase (fatty acid hydroxylase superfamily)
MFEGSQIMNFIGYFFIFNMSLILIDTLTDLITSKKRRWKDTGANFLIPMILIGFSPFQAIVGRVLVAQFQTWIHTEGIGKLGWLDKIFNRTFKN